MDKSEVKKEADSKPKEVKKSVEAEIEEIKKRLELLEKPPGQR